MINLSTRYHDIFMPTIGKTPHAELDNDYDSFAVAIIKTILSFNLLTTPREDIALDKLN